MAQTEPEARLASATPGAAPLPVSREILYGGLSGMLGKVIEYPFDTVKVRLQTQPSSGPLLYSGALDCFRQTIGADGWRGLYRGLSAPVAGAMAENAMLFYSFARATELVRAQRGLAPGGKDDVLGTMLAGGLSGGVTSFLLTPIELVKCRLQVETVQSATQRRPAIGPAARVQAVGSGQSAKLAADRASVHTASASGPASASPASATASSQIRPGSGSGGGSGSVWAVIRQVYREFGWRGFWRGQTGTLIRESGGSMCWFTLYEETLRLLRHPPAASPARHVGSGGSGGNVNGEKGIDIEVSGRRDGNTSTHTIVAGAVAGVGYNTLFFPADSIKSRQQVGAAGAGSSFLQTAAEIVRQHGPRGLFRGWAVTVLRAAPSNAVIFYVYETLCTELG